MMKPVSAPDSLGRIGRFDVIRQLGEGGMGVVYVARDGQLDREVAVKVLRPELLATGSAALLAEARAAARIAHPRVCQVFEVGEDEGRPFLVMELLEGEPLSARLQRGPVPAREAVDIMADVLDALQELHGRGIAHLDLKPSNVFLTPHGVKVLDFGLARPTAADASRTRTAGVMAGTPRYMAPEQIDGGPVDARADLFAAGSMLFEMLTGEAPFTGPTVFAVLQAVLESHPPALRGGASVTVLDRVVQKALAKRPADRHPSARAMSTALQAARGLPDGGAPARPQRLTRVAAFPFRVLRPDAEVDFLGLGMADAVGATLAAERTLVVRTVFTLPPEAREPGADVAVIGRGLDVDLLLTGTVQRAGTRLRVTAQLLEAATAQPTWSQVIDGAIDDVFALQDAVAARALEALAVDVAPAPVERPPASDEAYRLYLQGNQFGREPGTWLAAKDAYERSLAKDPDFAPAIAAYARIVRVLAKYEVDGMDTNRGYEEAEALLARAVTLAPFLPSAHYQYAMLETDLGRTPAALERLLRQLRQRRNEPELYAGLVLVCRHAGLLDASVAAHEMARALDPTLKTSIALTRWARGEFLLVLDEATSPMEIDLRASALAALGRRDEALRLVRGAAPRVSGYDVMGEMRALLRAELEGRFDEARSLLDRAAGIVPGVSDVHVDFPDGEGLYFVAQTYSRFGAPATALLVLGMAVDRGFFPVRRFRADAAMQPTLALPGGEALLARAEARHPEALEVFRAGDGPALLGVSASG
jgi:TolB-like protein